MSEIEHLMRQSKRLFILVFLNFIMLSVLFAGIGYVIWQSASLVSTIKKDVARSEQAVVMLQQKVHNMDMNFLIDKAMANVKENLEVTIKTAVNQSEFGESLNNLAGKVKNTQTKLENISQSLKAVNDKLKKIDTEQLAGMVSYNILNGLGNGFTSAAQAARPKLVTEGKGESSINQHQ